MYIKTDNKEIGEKLVAHYQAAKPIEVMGKLFLGNSIGYDYPDSCVAFHGSEVAWTGEGLPPAGIVCETKCGGVVRKVEVLCVTPTNILVREDNGREWLHDHTNPGSRTWHPIRTPEQIAAEKREADIEELRMLLSKVACDDYQAAVAMIDAGYHK